MFLNLWLHEDVFLSSFLWCFVMPAVRVVDNTLTIMIASAVGGAIAALMGFMLLKNFTLFVLAKLEEKKWVFTTTWICASNADISHCFIRVHCCSHSSDTVHGELPCLYSSNFVVFFLSCCSKECLVSSSGIDNTENGLSGSKADSKPTPKKKWEKCMYTKPYEYSYLCTFFAYICICTCVCTLANSLCSSWDPKNCLAVAFKGEYKHVHMCVQNRNCADDIQPRKLVHTWLFRMCSQFNYLHLKDNCTYQRLFGLMCLRWMSLYIYIPSPTWSPIDLPPLHFTRKKHYRCYLYHWLS